MVFDGVSLGVEEALFPLTVDSAASAVTWLKFEASEGAAVLDQLGAQGIQHHSRNFQCHSTYPYRSCVIVPSPAYARDGLAVNSNLDYFLAVATTS